MVPPATGCAARVASACAIWAVYADRLAKIATRIAIATAMGKPERERRRRGDMHRR